MTRSLFGFLLFSSICALASIACTHDWSLALASDDAGALVDATDAGATVDAGSDAPPTDADAEAGAFSCAGSLLCDNFDGPALGLIWDGITIGPGDGKAEAEPFAGARTAPNVLVAERGAATSGNSTAFPFKILTQTLNRARMELDVYPTALDSASYATIAGIYFEEGQTNEHKLRLSIRGNAAQLQELGASSVVIASHDLSFAFPVDEWTHIAFEVEVGGRIRAAVNGKDAIDKPASAGWKPSDRTQIVVGINFVTDPHGAVGVKIDNVRVDGS